MPDDYHRLKLRIVGHVFREWVTAFGEWLGAPERTEEETVASLRQWAQDSEIMETCEFTPEDALEWRQEYRREYGDIEYEPTVLQ